MLSQTGQAIARKAGILGFWDSGEKREFHIEGMRLGYISTLQASGGYKLVFHWVKM